MSDDFWDDDKNTASNVQRPSNPELKIEEPKADSNIAGTLNGMFIQRFTFKPETDTIPVEHFMELVIQVIKHNGGMHFTPELFEKLPDYLKKYFVVQNRYGKETRYKQSKNK